MHHRSLALLSLLAFTFLLAACPAPRGDDDDAADDDDSATIDDDDDAVSDDRVVVETTMGDFAIELYLDEAPITSANFLTYVDDGFFDGGDGLGATIFHRVIADFVAQGGGQTEDGTQKTTHAAIVNEATDSGLSNVAYSLAMARTNDPDSATSQWFINLVDNLFLDPGESTPDGYAVFGHIVEGADVVDAIGVTPTNGADQPTTAVVMEAVYRE
jgi:cyclophilin family peptidyl-prolyl cis-trans isomerase